VPGERIAILSRAYGRVIALLSGRGYYCVSTILACHFGLKRIRLLRPDEGPPPIPPKVVFSMVYTFLVGGEYEQDQKLTDNEIRYADHRSKEKVVRALGKSGEQGFNTIPGIT